MLMQTIIFDFGNVVGFFDHGRTLNRLQEFTDMTPAEMFQAALLQSSSSLRAWIADPAPTEVLRKRRR